MSISVSFLSPVNCYNCGEKFNLELWVLVDTAERPDLADGMIEGTFWNQFCPECNEPITTTQPFLVFRA